MDNRELDALIAERLFDWRWMLVPSAKYGADQAYAILVHPQDPRQQAWALTSATSERWSDWDTASYWPDAEGMPLRGLPHYSTDIAAAWQVVQAIAAATFSVRYFFMEALKERRERLRQEGIEGFWWFMFLEQDPARAIAEAALKALGVEL